MADFDFDQVFTRDELARLKIATVDDTLKANQAELARDPRLGYLANLSRALTDEGVLWTWGGDSEPVAHVQRFGGTGLIVAVALTFIDASRESGILPEGLACYIKAATYSTSFMCGDNPESYE